MQILFRKSAGYIKNHFSSYAKYYAVVLFITIVFIALEIRHPFHFLQDDVRGYFLPAAVHNYRSLVEDGEIALYNFHQFRGIASHACMEPAALYPVEYLSVFLSYLFSGNFFLSAEILVYFHLIIGGLGFFKFFRAMRFNNGICVLGGITWPLAGFVVFVSNSWVHISAAAAYFPWILFFSISILRTMKPRYLAGVVLSRILLLFSGHPEYFIYCMIFEGLTVLAIFVPEFIFDIRDNRISAPAAYIVKRVLMVITGYVLTFALSLPFVLPGLKQIYSSTDRSEPISFNSFTDDTLPLIDFFSGLLNPTQTKTIRENNWAHLYNLSFIGYIPLIFLIITGIEIIRKRIKREKADAAEIGLYLLSALGIFAFIWTTDTNFFARILYTIPLINMTYYHFKIILFTNFFLITVSMYGIDRIWRRFREIPAAKRIMQRTLSATIVLQFVTFISLYLWLPHMAFGFHLDKVPYDEPLKDVLKDGRFMSGGFTIYNVDPLNAFSLSTYSFPPIAFNYATLWNLYTVAGYETLVPTVIPQRLTHHGIYQNSLYMPVSFLKKWGVKYYIIKNDSFLVNPSARKIYKDDIRTVYADSEARPLFFFNRSENTSAVTGNRIRTNHIQLSVDPETDDILTVNFLYKPFFRAYIDGALTEVGRNGDDQMILPVAAGSHSVILRYEDPNFIIGVDIALITLGLCIIFLLLRSFLKISNIWPGKLPENTPGKSGKSILPKYQGEDSLGKNRNSK